MVYVPILKIDLPEPRLQELLPGLVRAAINTCTRVFDAVNDFLHPLSPEEQLQLYTATISHLPREFRKARKRCVEKNITDPDKMSEELEDAAFAFYRRRMREMIAGYSDEDTEDATFRRLMTPESATRALGCDVDPLGLQEETAAEAGPSSAAAAAAAAPLARLPSRGRRLTVTTLAGGAGLALGAGTIRLAALLQRLRKGRRKPKGRRPARPGSSGGAGGSRRSSDQGGPPAGGARAGSRAAPRTTPRKR